MLMGLKFRRHCAFAIINRQKEMIVMRNAIQEWIIYNSTCI